MGRYAHVFTTPFCEALVNPTLAGDLAWEVIPLQLRDSAGLYTGFAFEPSHPGDMAPGLVIFYCVCIVVRERSCVKMSALDHGLKRL
jgi:hypothetical protein